MRGRAFIAALCLLCGVARGQDGITSLGGGTVVQPTDAAKKAALDGYVPAYFGAHPELFSGAVGDYLTAHPLPTPTPGLKGDKGDPGAAATPYPALPAATPYPPLPAATPLPALAPTDAQVASQVAVYVGAHPPAAGTNGINATTTLPATATTPGLMPSAAVSQLAALPTIARASVTAAVPSVQLANSTTMTLTVPGAAVGGVVTINCPDTTIGGTIVLPLAPVTTAGQVSVTLKAVVAITAGNRTFGIAVINP